METLQHLAETLLPTPASLEGVPLPPLPPAAAGRGALRALWDGNPPSGRATAATRPPS